MRLTSGLGHRADKPNTDTHSDTQQGWARHLALLKDTAFPRDARTQLN
jgi:hypothetical protein